jgi:hypothetical protein
MLKYRSVYPLDVLLFLQCPLFAASMLSLWIVTPIIGYAFVHLWLKEIVMDYYGMSALLNRICWIVLAGYVVLMVPGIVVIASGGYVPAGYVIVSSALPMINWFLIPWRDKVYENQKQMWGTLTAR